MFFLEFTQSFVVFPTQLPPETPPPVPPEIFRPVTPEIHRSIPPKVPLDVPRSVPSKVPPADSRSEISRYLPPDITPINSSHESLQKAPLITVRESSTIST